MNNNNNMIVSPSQIIVEMRDARCDNRAESIMQNESSKLLIVHRIN
jgi:hypothetical protein